MATFFFERTPSSLILRNTFGILAFLMILVAIPLTAILVSEGQTVTSSQAAVGNPTDPSRADINGDGQVNSFDLSALLQSWKSANTASDLNQDGVVDAQDLDLLLSNFGTQN